MVEGGGVMVLSRMGCGSVSYVIEVPGWVAGWMAGWLGGWVAGWLGGWVGGWVAGWLVGSVVLSLSLSLPALLWLQVATASANLGMCYLELGEVVLALPCLKTGVGMHRRAARGRDEPSLVQSLGLLSTAYV